jgi:sugar lactone lactonase YvrE
VILGAAASLVDGQALSVVGARTTVPAVGLSNPLGVVVDAAGDVFISDPNNNDVIEVPAAGGTQSTIGVKLDGPSGLAIDAAGDIFICDQQNQRVVEVKAGSGAQVTIPTVGLSFPTGVAVDTNGDVFVADPLNHQVIEVPAAGGTQPTIGVGLQLPVSVAVDKSGNVYIVDSGTNTVWEVLAKGAGQTQIPTSGIVTPYGVAVDAAGNVFISDNYGNKVVEVPAGGGLQIAIAASGLSDPTGLTLDAAGDVFISDSFNHRVLKVAPVLTNFGDVNVCPAGQSNPAPCSKTLTFNYDITAGGTLGGIKVLTEGAANLDFTLASGSTCTGTVSANTSCVVNVTFAPKFAGLRQGAIEIADGTRNVLSTVPIYGSGVGPQIAFSPGAQTTIPASGLSAPWAVAVDATGDVFIGDTGNNRVVELTPGGAQTVLDSDLYQPGGVAVDGAGNVYIADTGDGYVFEVPAGGGTPVNLNAAFLRAPSALALDGKGDLFVLDGNLDSVLELPVVGPEIQVGAKLSFYPGGMAVDAAGDIYISDPFHNRVMKMPAGGGALTTVPAVGLNQTGGLAVDAAGDLFIADSANGRVVEVPAAGGPQTTIASGLSYPSDVAVSAAGDIFITSTGSNPAVEIHRSLAPSLSFAATPVGGTSSDSPKSVEVQNAGNAALTFSGLLVSANFTQFAGSGTPPDCSKSSSLAAGASCNLSIGFTPVVTGSLAGDATLTDNALNLNPAMQAIALTGMGLIGSQTITFPAIPAQTVGIPLTLTATASSGLPVSYSSSTTTVCTVSGSTASFLKAGTCTITASQAGNSNYAPAPPVTQSFAVNANTAPPSSAKYDGGDATTQGTWTGKYGGDGYLIANDATKPPAYATISLTGDSTYTWAASTTDVRALQTASGATTRIASTYYSGSSFTINVNLTDGNAHRLALYLLDWDSTSRAETISIVDANSNTVLDTEKYSFLENGKYAVWNITGHVLIQVTKTGGSNAVVSGIFFDPPQTGFATFVGSDSTTQGTWTNKYGSKGDIIANDANNPPSYAIVSFTGDSTYTWAASTTDPRALQTSSGATTRIASTYYSPTSFTINLNLTDGNTHKISLYLLDWDSDSRFDTFSILDANGYPITSIGISGFHTGAYMEWNIQGHVLIQVTKSGGANAVVSGIFFD